MSYYKILHDEREQILDQVKSDITSLANDLVIDWERKQARALIGRLQDFIRNDALLREYKGAMNNKFSERMNLEDEIRRQYMQDVG